MKTRTPDEGTTLVELLVAVVVLGVIIVPLTSGLMNGLTSGPIAAQRTSNTADAQLLATYFSPDVQSATSITTGGFASCAGVTGVFLQLGALDQAGSAHNVFYLLNGTAVQRVDCLNGGASSSTVTLVRDAVSTPTVAVSGDSPPLVTITVTDKGSATKAVPYSFTLQAEQRATP